MSSKTKGIKYQMQRRLESQIKLGINKKAEEKKAGGRSPYIHTGITAKVYIQHTKQFGTWLHERGMKHCTMEEAKLMAKEYILEKKSVFSQHTARSALARVFNCRGPELCKVESRNPSNITRGREMTPRAEAIEKNHKDLAEVGRSMGARKDKEFVRITAKDIRTDERGNLYVHIKGKGGRERDAFILPGRGRDLIEAAAKANPTGPLFHVPNGANVHSWRADYAARCYAYAMANGKASGEVYRCRDGSGRTYDKGAVEWTSLQLGHGEGRYYTVIYNYLSYGNEN